MRQSTLALMHAALVSAAFLERHARVNILSIVFQQEATASHRVNRPSICGLAVSVERFIYAPVAVVCASVASVPETRVDSLLELAHSGTSCSRFVRRSAMAEALSSCKVGNAKTAVEKRDARTIVIADRFICQPACTHDACGCHRAGTRLHARDRPPLATLLLSMLAITRRTHHPRLRPDDTTASILSSA